MIDLTPKADLLHGQDMGAPPPWENLQLWRQTRSIVIADQVRQALLHGKRLLDTAHVLSLVFHSDKQYASRGVGERRRNSNRTVLAGFAATFQVTFRRLAALWSLESSSFVTLALPPLT